MKLLLSFVCNNLNVFLYFVSKISVNHVRYHHIPLQQLHQCYYQQLNDQVALAALGHRQCRPGVVQL